MSSLFNLPWQQAFDGVGNTLAGAKLYFYVAGTSTPQNVYSDIGLGVALPNPVIANGSGRFSPIYMSDDAYKVSLYNAKDELIWTADNVYAQSIDADAAFALAAIRAVIISAGYTEEQAADADNFARAIYKYIGGATWFTETGSTDNVYVLTASGDYTKPEDYFDGMGVWFYTSRANTGAATINVADLGAKNIYREDGSALVAGDVSGLMHLIFNGTSFIIDMGVNLTSAQTIGGVKGFIDSPTVPDVASSDYSYKSANTRYVRNAFGEKMEPNYAGQIITAANTTSYTTPSAGWVQVQIDTNNGQTGYFYIDGKEVYHQFTAGDRSGVGTFRSGLFYVPQGKTVYATYSQSSANNYICFYPERA